jgi:hypothetical protein
MIRPIRLQGRAAHTLALRVRLERYQGLIASPLERVGARARNPVIMSSPVFEGAAQDPLGRLAARVFA